jgi:hypothetical protein
MLKQEKAFNARDIKHSIACCTAWHAKEGRDRDSNGQQGSRRGRAGQGGWPFLKGLIPMGSIERFLVREETDPHPKTPECERERNK